MSYGYTNADPKPGYDNTDNIDNDSILITASQFLGELHNASRC